MKKILVFLFVFSLLSASIVPIEFDWTRFMLKITTIEQTDILVSLHKALLATQYDGNQTIADYLHSHPAADEKIIKLIHDYTTTQQNFLTDGGIEYVHQLNLTNKIMHELIPEQQIIHLLVPMLCPCCGQEWPRQKPIPDTIDLIPQHSGQSDYTGIIFDCRGYPLTPCLFPRIVTKDGKEVYSTHFALTSAIVEWGLVHYTTDAEMISPRAGRKPLIVNAIGVTALNHTDIVISTSDAQRIHGSIENIQLLKECRVVIIFG